ncbi:hypothetical protein DSO57_1031128 [Entomophthora muscae]|nr:hypothetical protein DSO57_1031128 [Entomophthora muscae]
MLISMIPGLTALNLSPITPRERVDAELYYLNQIASSSPKHPQFDRLCELYGQPKAPTKSDGSDSALVKNRLFLLNILLCDNPPSGDNPLADLVPIQSSQKQFLKTASVRTLRMALPKLLHLSPGKKYQLYGVISSETSGQSEHASNQNSAQIVLLDNPVRPLQSFYLLKEGDSICVVPS